MAGSASRVAALWRRGWGLSQRFAPRRPSVARAVVVALMAGITVLRWYVDGAGQSVALLYVVPIALCALRFGRRGGVSSATIGIVAFGVLEVVRGRGDTDVTGWVAPILAMALMGGLVGSLSESAVRQEEARRDQARQLEELRTAQRAALEAGDSVVQRMAAARWMLEAGHVKEALEALDAAVVAGIVDLSQVLPPRIGPPTEGAD